MDGTSRLHDAAGEPLQHGLMTACFSERVVVDGASAVPLPDALPLWQAALLGCAVVTGVGAVRNVARVRVGETAAWSAAAGSGCRSISGLVLSGAVAHHRGRSRSREARARLARGRDPRRRSPAPTRRRRSAS